MVGLLYAFPVSLEETDFVIKEKNKITLKTYGLPYIFWIYAFCILTVIGFMYFGVREPILKLIELGDTIDAFLGYSLFTTIFIVPLTLISFFFYEKRIIKDDSKIIQEYRIFGLKFLSKEYQYKKDALFIESFLSSPNVARIKGGEESLGFQNKGYFILWLKTQDNKKVQIDKHSRKSDLEKLKNLIENN